jgi:hypothetical protein
VTVGFGVRQLAAALLQASLLAARDWQFCRLKGSAGKLAPEKAAASCRTPKKFSP